MCSSRSRASYFMCDGLISEQVIYLGPAEAFAAAGLTRSGARAATDINS